MARLTRRPPTASPKDQIQDWLTLIDPDGAFLTTSELTAVFPHGLDPMDREVRTELRARVADLNAADDAAGRADLRRWLLSVVLDWDDLLAEAQRIPATATIRAAEHGVTLRPTHVLLNVDDQTKVRLAVFAWPSGTPLERRIDTAVSGDSWQASPIQRAETWCRESGTPLALVTDDDSWSLIWAPRGAPAASGRWTIGDLADETVLQAGFVSLLGARRFFAVSDEPGTGETLERLFERAADAEAELTKGLGTSVRQSVELLVAAISRDDVGTNGRVLADIPGTEVYESAVTVLMRLVFLLFAEERRLLPAEDPLWAESYSVLSLRDDLRQTATRDGHDALERRTTAWHRLLATFRAVHGGVHHDRLTLPAYGGSLFDPDRFPFLEGHRVHDHIVASGVDLGPAPDAERGPGRPVAIDDRTVLAVLDSLLTIQVKSGRSKVAQRVSYKALDVEQIGHCYEGLLDHGAIPIDDLSVGLVGPEGGEPELQVSQLEAFGDRDALCEWLSDKTRCNKAPATLAKLLDQRPEGVDLARLRVACGHHDDIVDRVMPYWGILRQDLRDLPIVLLPGSMFVTQISTRRNTGTQYTTKALAEEVVKHTLEQFVYDPGPQNEADQERWRLKAPAAILDLRVCDPAVGSGAILTAAGRYLADRLVESILEHGTGEGREASRLRDLANAPAEEHAVLARREIVDHCLYGVDKNPIAAEMAKLSLWLTTMARERPFTFLDHAIQVGDSLLGITDIDQLRWLHLDPSQRQGQRGFESIALDIQLKEANELARRLRETSVVTVRDANEKRHMHDELRVKLADLSVVADAVVGATVSTTGKSRASMEQQLDSQMGRIRSAFDEEGSEGERESALSALHGVATGWLRTDLPDEVPMPWTRQCLHWPLAFPEVFLSNTPRGFDAIVGNPPFLGNKYWKEAFGSAFQGLVKEILGETPGKIDLSVVFLRRSYALLAESTGCFGLLGSTQSAEGQSIPVGLARVCETGTILRAVKGRPWPGDAKVRFNIVWVRRGDWAGARRLNDREVARIDAGLGASRVHGQPLELGDPDLWAFAGVDNSRGTALVLTEHDPWLGRIRDLGSLLLRPYVTGEDLGARPVGVHARWVVDAGDSSIEQIETGEPLVHTFLKEVVEPTRTAEALKSYRGLADRWWQFWNHRATQFRRLRASASCVVLPKVAMYILPARASTSWCFTNQVIVIEENRADVFGVLRSTFFVEWMTKYCTSFGVGGGIRPSVSKGVNTFAMPNFSESVASIGDQWAAESLSWCEDARVGLTSLQNAIHENDPTVATLVALSAELDLAVAAAYGWSDLELNHQHMQTSQGMRFAVSPEAKDELLDRLLELNHQRHAEEAAAGLHDNRSRKKARRRASTATGGGQGALL